MAIGKHYLICVVYFLAMSLMQTYDGHLSGLVTRIYNDMTWVTYANQVHTLSHVAWFMEAYEVSAVGALSLEGLEHGNYSTKLLENTRIFNGSSKKSLKQLFRKLETDYFIQNTTDYS